MNEIKRQIQKNWVTLEQCCPTLSPFDTCGDKRFKCGDIQLFKYGFSNDKYIKYLINYDKSGDRKPFVVTIVANVATERIWLDTPVTNFLKFFEWTLHSVLPPSGTFRMHVQVVLRMRTKNLWPCFRHSLEQKSFGSAKPEVDTGISKIASSPGNA
jgi:hypothetical protein